MAEGTPRALALLVAVQGSSGHALPPDLARWRAIAEEEERRARGGAVLSAARVAALSAPVVGKAARADADAVADSVADPVALDDALRPGGVPRPAWLRAAAAAAAIDDPATGDLIAALLLCAAGTTGRLLFLPFAAVEATERAEAVAAWRAGDHDPWARAALGAAAGTVRHLRVAVHRFVRGLGEDEARLETLGRAAITARRALAHLRSELALTVPTLAGRLGGSRPAAGDALERLRELGVATEVTGRGRDRVFALTAALALVASPSEFGVEKP
ncbi:MAG: hypothetical protein WD771_05160 [Gemmatimonadaceae bacterium]